MKFGRQRVGVAQRRTRESGIAAWVEAVGARSVRLGGLLTGVGVSGAWTPVGGRSSVARGAPTRPTNGRSWLEGAVPAVNCLECGSLRVGYVDVHGRLGFWDVLAARVTDDDCVAALVIAHDPEHG